MKMIGRYDGGLELRTLRQDCGTRVVATSGRRAGRWCRAGWTAFFLPLMSRAQDAGQPGAAGPVFPLTPLGIGLIAVVGILLLALMVCAIFLYIYRARFIRYSTKCQELEPELQRTQKKLEDTTVDLGETSRKFHEEVVLHERLLNDSGAAIFKLNNDGKCVYINPKLEQLIGLPKQQVFRNGLLNAVHPDDRAQVRKEWRTLADREASYGSTYRLLREDGSVAHVVCRASTLRDGKNIVTGYLGLLVDVTDRVEECAAARTGERRSNYFVQETAGGFYELRPDQPIAIDLPPNEIADLIYRTMSVSVCNSPQAELYGLSAGELTGARLNTLAGGCGIFQNPDRIKEFIAAGFKSIGTEVVWKDRRGNHLYLRNDTVGIVEDGYLVSVWGAQHDVSRQKREMEKLAGRAGFLQSILDALPADVFVKDTRCRFLYVSRGFAERTGIPADDWIEKTVFEVMPATPRSVNKNSIEVMKTGELRRAVDPCQTVDGEKWMETLETPLVGSAGLIEGVVGLSIDVTVRTQKELALQKTEAQFRNLVENVPNGILMAEVESKKLTYVNPACCDFFGYTEEELLDMRIGDLHSPGSRRQVLAEWEDRARHKRRFENALPCLRKDRSVVMADVEVSAARLNDGDIFVGVYSDASARRKIEADLISQRDYQIDLLRNSAALLAVVDPGRSIRFVNDALQEVLGYDEGELIGKPYVTTLVSESDHGQLANAFSQCGIGREADFECRLVTKTGGKRIVACRIRPFLNQENKLEAFTVVGIDMTQRRMQEEQLRCHRDQLSEQLTQCEAKLKEAVREHQKSEQALEQTTEELKRLEEAITARAQRFEQELSEREKQEAHLHQNVTELERQKAALKETLALRQAELGQAADQLIQLETLLQESREKFARDRETLSAQVKQRTQVLEQELEERRKREELLETNREELSRHRAELEEALELRTRELETQTAKRKAEESELRKMSKELKELKELSSSEKEELTQHVKQFKEEVAKSKSAEQALRKMEAGLPQKIKELEALIEQRTQEVAHETDERKKVERKLLQFSEQFKEEGVKSRSAEQALRQLEAVLPQQIKELEAVIEQRTQKVAQEADKRKKAERDLLQLSESVGADHRLVADLNEDVFSLLSPVMDLSNSILQDVDLPEDRRRQITEINRSSRQMLEIMKYRLELTKLDDGDIQIKPEVFDLQAFIDDVGTEFSAKAKSKDLFFAVSLSGEISGKVVADQVKTRLVLCNLLEHALDCTHRGQLGLHAICEKLEDGRKKVIFQLMYSGLTQDATDLAGMLGESGVQKPCRDMTDMEFRMNLNRRYAGMLGGSLCLENRSGYKPFINLVLTFDREPVDDTEIQTLLSAVPG